jgi:hypothetical protein
MTTTVAIERYNKFMELSDNCDKFNDVAYTQEKFEELKARFERWGFFYRYLGSNYAVMSRYDFDSQMYDTVQFSECTKEPLTEHELDEYGFTSDSERQWYVRWHGIKGNGRFDHSKQKEIGWKDMPESNFEYRSLLAEYQHADTTPERKERIAHRLGNALEAINPPEQLVDSTV